MPENDPATPAESSNEKFHERDTAQTTFESVRLRDAQFHMADMGNARFHNVNLGNAQFEDINLRGAVFHDINFSDVTLSAAQMGGATFKHIGLPPGSDNRQRGVTFEEAHLNDSTFRECDLSRVQVTGCKTDGMTIDGIAVADLLAAYHQTK